MAAIAIVYLTLTPDPGVSGPFPDTVGHFLLFFFLGVTSAIWYATSDIARRSPGRALLGVLLVLWIFAGATEWGQELVLDRHVEGRDWLANAAGAIVGLFVGSFFTRLLLQLGARRD